jgi:hypothetical protein
VLGDGVWLVKRRPDKKAPRHESVGRVGLVEAMAAKLDGLGGALCSVVGSGRGIAGGRDRARWSRATALTRKVGEDVGARRRSDGTPGRGGRPGRHRERRAGGDSVGVGGGLGWIRTVFYKLG